MITEVKLTRYLSLVFPTVRDKYRRAKNFLIVSRGPLSEGAVP
jgi:hypothetical protein